MRRRIHSYVWSTLSAVILIITGIVVSVKTSDYSNLAILSIIGALSFTLVSCLILDNNFVGEMIFEIGEWGFVKMPCLIFTLDLDGIIWLLTVKLLFWILGFILSIITGILALAVGLVVSAFVYPFALYKSYHGVGEYI